MSGDPFDVGLDEARRRHSLKWRRYPPDVIPLWVAETDFPAAPPIAERLGELVGRSDFGYPPEDDQSEIRVAIAGWMRRRQGWDVDPNLVTLVPDTMRALEIAVMVFTEPGDPVVLADPVYFPFAMAIEDAGRRPLRVAMHRRGLRWELDLDQLEQHFARRDVSLYLHCHPHNPTGTVHTAAELAAIADLAERHDVVVASDEIHADLAHRDERHVPFVTGHPAAPGRTITASSASKAFNLPGLKCSFFVAGDEVLHRRMRDTPIRWRHALSIAGLEATIAAFTGGDDWLDGLVAHLGAMRDHVIGRLDAIDGSLVAARPDATYLLWTDWRTIDLPTDPETFLLERARVALTAGEPFGPSAAGFMRLNFGTSRRILDEALDRIGDAVEGLR